MIEPLTPRVTDISARKAQLRAEYIQRRSLSAGDAARFAAAIAENALALLPPGRVLAGYAAMRSEVPVWELLAQAEKRGDATALPYIETECSPLRFRLWNSSDPLTRGPHGIREPLAAAPETVPELILAPLLAFDRRGYRLGYGAGYYDRTLAVLRRTASPPMVIGIAFSVQEAKTLPAGPHDERLDWIVTEKEVIRVNQASSIR